MAASSSSRSQARAWTRERSGGSLSTDELEIYFSSDRPGGVGMFDIWFARRASRTEPFGAAENLTVINTAFDDLDPWISADGRTLLHNRDTLEIGGRDADVWQTRRACTP